MPAAPIYDVPGFVEDQQVKVLKTQGMQGRLGLAQAILNKPELLFLDEPMSGLDPLGYKETRDIILNLNKMGTTSFHNILTAKSSRLEVVVTFLALLELVKRHMVGVNQSEPFGEINLQPEGELTALDDQWRAWLAEQL